MTPPGRRFTRGLLALPLAAALCAACASGGFDGTVYRGSELSFRVARVPSDWQALEAEGALLAFRDPAGPASIVVNGRCGKDGDDVPLEALTHHLFLHFDDRVVESQERVRMDGREALHTELLANLDGVRKRFTVFVLKKNGCVYDFAHVAPPDAPADSRRTFVEFVQGFATIQP